MESPAPHEGSTLAQKIAWVLFCATCVQLVLFKSYVTVIPGVKADLFGGVLCAFTLAACLFTADRKRLRVAWPEVLISLVLLAFTLVAGFLSSIPWSSSIIGLVFASTSLGGYWCARLAVNSDSRQRGFVWLCLIVLSLYAILALWGHYVHGTMQYLVDDPHQTANLIILLSFGPLALLAQPSFLQRSLAVVVLAPCAVLLYLCGLTGVEAGILIPMAVTVPVAFIGSIRARNRAAMFALLLVMAAVTTHYVSYVSRESFSARAYQADRIEYYPFSAHIAKQHPFFGIGLRVPREEYLSDYEMRHPNHTKQQFAQQVARLKVCQNQFLTLMVGLGIPFLILYLFALVVLVSQLVRAALGPGGNTFLSPMVLLVPVVGGILYLLVMDFLLLAQISWFFHVLLGLIPAVAHTKAQQEKARTWGAGSVVGCVAAAALGIFVGTHPALHPARLPSFQEISESFRSLPAIGPLLDQPQPRSTGETAQPVEDGHLVVTMKNYDGSVQRWAVMCIVDTSKSMAQQSEQWRPQRLQAATDFVEDLARGLPAGSIVGVRGFGTAGPLRRKGAEIKLRLSRVLVDWTKTPVENLVLALTDAAPGENNLCAAAEFSLDHDFAVVGDEFAPRIVLITDGNGECSISELADRIVMTAVRGRTMVLDTIGLGMRGEGTPQPYSEAAAKTFGVFLQAGEPEDAKRLVSEYIGILGKPVRRPLVVSGKNQNYEALPGAILTLPPGSYTVTLPEIPGLSSSDREIKEVRVSPGERTVLNLSVEQGRVRVEK